MRTKTREDILQKTDLDETTGCWNWNGTLSPSGYGVLTRRNRAVQAHRFMYELTNGAPPPSGLELDHLCRNRRCINPAHLEAVTHRENMRRSESPPGFNARKTFCNSGHPLSGDNLRHNTYGVRVCRECRLVRNAKVLRQEASRRLAVRNGEFAASPAMRLLVARRRQSRIKQLQIAAAMGSSVGHVGKTERGLRTATQDFIARYDRALSALAGVAK